MAQYHRTNPPPPHRMVYFIVKCPFPFDPFNVFLLNCKHTKIESRLLKPFSQESIKAGFLVYLDSHNFEEANRYTQILFISRSLLKRDMAVAAQRPVPDMAEFDSIHMVTFGLRFINRTPDVVQWCRRYGLLAQYMECPTCNFPCTEGVYRRAVDGVAWRCPRCRKTINIRKGSFFEKSHLQLWQILALTYQ